MRMVFVVKIICTKAFPSIGAHLCSGQDLFHGLYQSSRFNSLFPKLLAGSCINILNRISISSFIRRPYCHISWLVGQLLTCNISYLNMLHSKKNGPQALTSRLIFQGICPNYGWDYLFTFKVSIVSSWMPFPSAPGRNWTTGSITTIMMIAPNKPSYPTILRGAICRSAMKKSSKVICAACTACNRTQEAIAWCQISCLFCMLWCGWPIWGQGGTVKNLDRSEMLAAILYICSDMQRFLKVGVNCYCAMQADHAGAVPVTWRLVPCQVPFAWLTHPECHLLSTAKKTFLPEQSQSAHKV